MSAAGTASTGAARDPFGAFTADDVAIAPTGRGGLDGLSFAAKDLFDVAGFHTRAGNPRWPGNRATAARTAAAVARMLGAGARLRGKTHTDEISLGLLGMNPHYGTPVNPRAPERVPGGSSSGSAVAVAGRLVDMALGTDTGGSVRVPAACCGIYGIRTTHGRVSREGMMTQAPSFDTVGWFARDAATLARVGAVLLDGERAALRPAELIVADDAFAFCDGAVAAVLQGGLERLRGVFGAWRSATLAPDGDLRGLRAAQRTLQRSEYYATFRDWLAEEDPPLAHSVSGGLIAASRIGAEELDAARALRSRYRSYLDSVLDGGRRVLCFPTMPCPPPRRDWPFSRLAPLLDRMATMNAAAGLAGVPQLNLPLAEIEGAPVGLSLLGARGSDEDLLDLASRMEGAS